MIERYIATERERERERERGVRFSQALIRLLGALETP